jgi:protein CpxP
MRGNWTKIALLFTALTLPATILPAQQAAQKAPEKAMQCAPGGKGHYGNLQLTPGQKKQLRELRMETRDRAAIIRSDKTLTQEQKAAKLRELRRSSREKRQAVLTPEQREQVKQMRASRRGQMAKELGLTPEQQGKLRETMKAGRQQRRAVLQNSSLTDNQKLAQLKQIRQATRTQMASILTPEQLAKWQQMRQHHGHGPHGPHGMQMQ